MIPMPMNEIDAMARTTSAAKKFASGIERLEEERADAEQEDGAEEPVEDREHALARQVHRPRERRHERVLDRPLPALPGDGLHEEPKRMPR